MEVTVTSVTCGYLPASDISSVIEDTGEYTV